MKTIAFVILTRNSESYIEACLDSVQALSEFAATLYIADNGSIDRTPEILCAYESRHPDQITLCLHPQNTGTTYPRNRLLELIPTDIDFICVLDSDTVINEDAIRRLAACLDHDPRTMIAVPRMWNADDEEQPSCKRFPTPGGKFRKAFARSEGKGDLRERYTFFPAKETERKPGGDGPPLSADQTYYDVEYGISACWFMRGDVRSRVGFLDEKYFYAPEDVDFCAEVWKAGYRVRLVSGASIYHLTQRLSHQKLFSRLNVKHVTGLCRFFWKQRLFLRRWKGSV